MREERTMFSREDLETLVRAAERALRKMYLEYHYAQPDATPGECWAEAEALADALAPFWQTAV
jgi:hypothetical protein